MARTLSLAQSNLPHLFSGWSRTGCAFLSGLSSIARIEACSASLLMPQSSCLSQGAAISWSHGLAAATRRGPIQGDSDATAIPIDPQYQ